MSGKMVGMTTTRQCYRTDEHDAHHADDMRSIPGGYDCPGVIDVWRPRAGDTNLDIAHKLEQWMWDESQELEGWQQALLAEATRRLRAQP